MKKVNIIDTTLREGNQSPGVKFDVQSSIDVANFISKLGVSTIEIGHPLASELEFDRVKAVVDLNLGIPVLSHARANSDDIKAVKETGAQWVGIFVGVNALSQKNRVNRTFDEILKLIDSNVKYAKKLGLKVRYTVEDASRTEPDLLKIAFLTALNAGADRICFPDTVGTLEPRQVYERIQFLVQELNPENIEVHLHDDRGLSMANALAAIEAGANWISTSVNGIGERCGITDTCALLANLVHNKQADPAVLSHLLAASLGVQKITGYQIDKHRPVVGENAFIHKAKLHVDAALRNKETYHWVAPSLFNK